MFAFSAAIGYQLEVQFQLARLAARLLPLPHQLPLFAPTSLHTNVLLAALVLT